MRIIVPCAGFGARMNMPPDKSKELLPDENGKPMIEWGLSLFSKGSLLLIIREGKQDLIDYCIKNQYLFIVVPETQEFPETILKSKEYWEEDNLLLLPDTRFEPSWKVGLVGFALCHDEIVLGTHMVDDISKWGAIRGNELCEKPNETGPGEAWGFIGFKGPVGNTLFNCFLDKGRWVPFNGIGKIKLDSFKDLTREIKK